MLVQGSLEGFCKYAQYGRRVSAIPTWTVYQLSDTLLVDHFSSGASVNVLVNDSRVLHGIYYQDEQVMQKEVWWIETKTKGKEMVLLNSHYN